MAVGCLQTAMGMPARSDGSEIGVTELSAKLATSASLPLRGLRFHIRFEPYTGRTDDTPGFGVQDSHLVLSLCGDQEPSAIGGSGHGQRR